MPATPCAFVDTEVFHRHHFHFTSQSFRRLAELASSGRLRIVLTDVTIREVRGHLDKAAQSARKDLSNLDRMHRAVRELNADNDLSPLQDITEAEFARRFHGDFDEFLESTRAEVVSVDGVRPNEVFDRYFNSQPPFDGSGKKSEFPDAFVSAALRSRCQDATVGSMYVVSDDGDWRRICNDTPEFTHFKRLEELLEEFAQSQPAVDFDAIKHAVRKSSDSVLSDLRAHIERGDIYFYAGDSILDGEVDDVDVEDAEIEDINIIEAKDGRAIASVECRVTVTVSVTGDDPDSVWRDDDDGSLHSAFRTHGSGELEFTVRGTVDIEYEVDAPTEVTVYDAEFPKEGIEVSDEDVDLEVDYGDEGDLGVDYDPSWNNDEPSEDEGTPP